MKKVSLLGFLSISLLFFGACSNSDNSETINSLEKENKDLKEKVAYYEKNSESSSETKSPLDETNSEDTPTFKLNEEAVIVDENSQKIYSIKIIEATTNQSAFPEHMINLDNYNTEKMVAVKIEYKNIALDEPFLPYSNYFQAYGKDGKALVQVNQQNGQESVAVGRTSTTQLFWELDVNGNEFNEFEIDYIPSSKLATFDLTVTH
ncbi:hypothetical protein [uncultured Vagococcus sp.]|uniref:hypothetical protein n=1 Tax=uncultured Vagococcus sp. TaxID=189676 RepID=UPI00258C9495|nr:hypothetical protein [uncultured Vagococcus sp.]